MYVPLSLLGGFVHVVRCTHASTMSCLVLALMDAFMPVGLLFFAHACHGYCACSDLRSFDRSIH